MSLDSAEKHFTDSARETREWLIKEISGLRSGRAQPQAVEGVLVEHYGARTPLNGLASVSSLDARTLLVSPWDKGAVSAIAKALTEAELGVMPIVDGQVIRLSFPTLTQEVREQTIKQLHKKGEEARVRLRQGRDEALKMVREEKEAGKLTEDDFYNGRSNLDEMINDESKALGEITAKKEADIASL